MEDEIKWNAQLISHPIHYPEKPEFVKVEYKKIPIYSKGVKTWLK